MLQKTSLPEWQAELEKIGASVANVEVSGVVFGDIISVGGKRSESIQAQVRFENGKIKFIPTGDHLELPMKELDLLRDDDYTPPVSSNR